MKNAPLFQREAEDVVGNLIQLSGICPKQGVSKLLLMLTSLDNVTTPGDQLQPKPQTSCDYAACLMKYQGVGHREQVF